MSKNSLLIKSKSPQSLRIVEGLESTAQNKKYVFTGVFTACSTPDHVIINRNQRSYPENEMLRHLSYLRENIKTNGFILGELDHPVDRFDTQMKEASHKITDLWYDQNTHCVMGTIEILDTPNGEIAKRILDSGYPCFVSSRAAGEVDQKTKEVHIEQIFTYDIVCTPGFSEARLERVSESLSTDAYNYITESLANETKDKKSTKKYGVLIEGVSVCEMSCSAPISKEAQQMKNKKVNISDLVTPLNENEEEQPKNEYALPNPPMNPTVNEDDEKSDDTENGEKTEKKDGEEKDGEEKEDKKVLSDEEKKENRESIIEITTVEAGDEITDEEKIENRESILGIESIGGDSDEEDKEDDNDEDADKADKKEEEKTDKDDVEECDEKPAEDKVLNDAKKGSDACGNAEKILKDAEKLLKKVEKKDEVKESIIREFPFTISLSEENFAKFAALKPSQKKKCNKFIIEHGIFDVARINETWTTPLVEERRLLKNWLRLASAEDKQLFAEAPVEVQDAIEESAKYVRIETEADAEAFWSKQGLRQRAAQKYINEMNTQRYEITDKREDMAVNEKLNDMGYSMNYFKFLEDNF